MTVTIGRRELLAALGGGAAAWPFAARAQQQSVMAVIGFLNGGSRAAYAPEVDAFRQGLKETGYVEGQNMTIDYRWAEDQYDRLPSLAAKLVQQKVTVIAATSTPAALAAKAVTSTVPIVFTTGGDPIKLGLVASLAHPGGNVTGSTQLSVEVGPKRLELARELFPGATTFALLVNPTNPVATAVSKDYKAVLAIVREDAVCRRLMTVPGVGPVVAVTFKSAVDDPSRIAKSKAVGALFGLTPKKYQSGEKDVTGGITRTGDEMVRTALYEAANVLLSRITRFSKLKRWGMDVAKRRGSKRAKVALARKIGVILHRMWIDGTTYRWAEAKPMAAQG